MDIWIDYLGFEIIKTFVVITKRFKKSCIHRFSATSAFFLLAPWNPIRRAGIYIATSQAFDYFVILTIIVNCIFLAEFIPGVGDKYEPYSENIFLGIYTIEMIVKLSARGFVINTHTYLRDAWNWLDFTIVVAAFVSIGMGIQENNGTEALRPFRVVRAVKAISIIPGLKTIMGALLKSMNMLMEVIVLTFFCMMVFALFTLQVYVGILRQKCVRDIEPGLVLSHYEYALYIKNSSNWDTLGDDWRICGNATGAGRCPRNSTCLPDIGGNPDGGYTSFDDFSWALLASFQLITLDFWENIYNKVIRANGPFNVLFFFVVVFFGSFYLINLMLAVVSMSYEEEALQAGKMEKEKERKREKRERKDRKEKERKERVAAAAAAAIAVRTDGEPGSNPGKGGKVGEDEARGQSNTNNKDESTSDTNHLQLVEGNMNGSNSASNVSLNGPPVLGGDRPGNSVKLELEYDSDKVGLGGKEDGRKDSVGGGTGEAGGGGGTGSEEQLVGDGFNNTMVLALQNPLADDCYSIISMDNCGDIPNVNIKDAEQDELVDRNCVCCGRCCYHYPHWLKFQNMLYIIVTDIIFELFISLCVIINVLGMAVEYDGMPKSLQLALEDLNLAFTIIFTVEAALKLMAMGKEYFDSTWNNFDFIIVIVSWVDQSITFAGSEIEALSSIKVIRLVRLLRIFRLAQTWSTMRLLISIIIRTLGALGNLSLILLLSMYIFAVLGMQLLGKYYTDQRWSFKSFSYSTYLVFRILCGEWIEPLWECMDVAGALCALVFFPTLIFGNFIILNLFLALMLNSFATDSLNKGKEEMKEDKMKEGWAKLKGLFKAKNGTIEPQGGIQSKKPSIADIVEELKKHQNEMYGQEDEEDNCSAKSGCSVHSIADENRNMAAIELTTPNTYDVVHMEDEVSVKESNKTSSNGMVKNKRNNDITRAFQTDRGKFSEFNTAMSANSKKKTDEENVTTADKKSTKNAWELVKQGDEKKVDKEKKDSQDVEAAENEDNKENVLHNCLPPFCVSCNCCSWYHNLEDTPSGRYWTRTREIALIITENRVFEYFILIVIMTSSIALCFEDVYLYATPKFEYSLQIMNYIFVAIFIIEMFLKWTSLGFHKYFTSAWTVLDFAIVVISVMSLAADSLGLGDLTAFKALRTLKALRPLRAISRWQGMRIVVNALVYAIPDIGNVFLVCILFWLLFAIMGVQFFGGLFYRCVDKDISTRDPVDIDIVPNKTVCEQYAAEGRNYEWRNADVTFDNVGQGYLALFQVATFEGWMEVMGDASDISGKDMQPLQNNCHYSILFFIVFIVVGSFFSLNLFIGVIIENFNKLKKKYDGGYMDILLTDSQKNYYNTMKKLGNRKPQKTIKRPKNRLQEFFFDVAVSTKFELAIVCLIFLNMIAMAFERYRQSDARSDILDIVNIVFTTIFTLESIVKIIGLRWHYFRQMWNVFDLIIVILSVIGVILDDLVRDIFITPTLLRVVRVFRIGRVLRLIKAAKGIRKLLFALVISLPALVNIGMLLFIMIFIFAIVGMSIFQNVKRADALNDMTNFETFWNSFILLFRLTTAAGWNDVLYPLMNYRDCNSTHFLRNDGMYIESSQGDCGSPEGAAIFFAIYIMITYLIIVNMYIAVILENFSQAHEQEEVGITEDDFEMFYIVWERYDPHATQFIKVESLSDLVADLDLPLGIPKPNEIALVAFDLPIMEGERLHCLDILTSLIKYVLGGVEDTEEFRDLKQQMEERYKAAFPTRVTQVQISSTMARKKEDVAAKTLQRAWRKHKAQQSIRKITSMAMEAKLNKSQTRTSFSTALDNSPLAERPLSSSSSGSVSVTISTSKHGNTLTVPKAEHV